MLIPITGPVLYRSRYSPQQCAQRAAQSTALLPAILRTVPIGLALVVMAWLLLERWGALHAKSHILWLLPFFGPFYWALHHMMVRFTKPELILREKRLEFRDVQPIFIRWRHIKKAILQTGEPATVGKLILETRFGKKEQITLPDHSDIKQIHLIFKAQLDERFELIDAAADLR